MKYRSEIDGLRAIAVISVVLLNAEDTTYLSIVGAKRLDKKIRKYVEKNENKPN